MNNRNALPKIVRQAFAFLDALACPENRKLFLEQSKADFVCDQHFGLGLWIRNNWIYGTDDKSCLRMLAGLGKGELCLEHPDSVSSRFLAKYYDHLKRVDNSLHHTNRTVYGRRAQTL